VNPQNISVTRKERRPSGQYSEVRVTALGIAPPRPTPVMNRRTISTVMLGLKAESRLAAPKNTTEKMRIAFRPNRSARGPMISAPNMSPISPDPKSGANCAGVAPHSALIAGAMKPIDARSNPSMATMKKHSTRSTICVDDS
jgi:hypothetical protein